MYLLSDLDKHDENDEDEQVVKDADSPYDDVDDLESKVTNVGEIQRQVVSVRRRRRDIVPGSIWQRRVLHCL